MTLASQIMQEAKIVDAPVIIRCCRYVLTEPHMEGTMKSFVFVQYCINLKGEDRD